MSNMHIATFFRELGISKVLTEAGFTNEPIQLAATQIVSRAVYPASELKTASWIKENSAIGELTGQDCEKITKDKLYESALRLYRVKDQLEQHLSYRTNELFDISDKIVLYDLTNTYFEARYDNSILAKYGSVIGNYKLSRPEIALPKVSYGYPRTVVQIKNIFNIEYGKNNVFYSLC